MVPTEPPQLHSLQGVVGRRVKGRQWHSREHVWQRDLDKMVLLKEVTLLSINSET